jgi:CBS domain-containing membrane protein
MRRVWKYIGPHPSASDHHQHVIAAFGALSAIGLIAGINLLLTGSLLASLPLVAPMGASAVIVFCLPNSPLARPWNVVIGNVASALVGVICARFIPQVEIAAAVAVFAAISGMALSRSIHPPGGAVALTAVLSGAPIKDLGFAFAFNPVFLSSLTLVLAAIGFHTLKNRLTKAE